MVVCPIKPNPSFSCDSTELNFFFQSMMPLLTLFTRVIERNIREEIAFESVYQSLETINPLFSNNRHPMGGEASVNRQFQQEKSRIDFVDENLRLHKVLKLNAIFCYIEFEPKWGAKLSDKVGGFFGPRLRSGKNLLIGNAHRWWRNGLPLFRLFRASKTGLCKRSIKFNHPHLYSFYKRNAEER